MSTPRSLTRLMSSRAAILLIAIVAAVAYFVGLLHAPNLGDDSAHFLGLAEALVHRGEYYFNFRPHTKFPPGFSLLLAPLAAIAAEHTQYLTVSALFAVLSALLAYAYLAARRRRRLGVIAALLFLCSSPVYERATRIVAADFAFMAVSLLTLVCAYRFTQRKSAYAGFCWALGVLLLVPTTVLVRSPGLALAAACVLSALLPRRQVSRGERPLLLIAGLLGFLSYGAWQWWSAAQMVSEWDGEYMHSYGSQFWLIDPHRPSLGTASLPLLIIRVLSNIPVQAARLAELVTNVGWISPLPYSPLVLVPFLCCATGVYLHLRRRRLALAELYFLGYCAIVLLWPFDEGSRYIAAVFPLALHYLVDGGRVLGRAFLDAPPVSRMVIFSIILLYAGIQLLLSEELHAQGIGSVVTWLIALPLAVAPNMLLRRAARGALLVVVPVMLGLGIARNAIVAAENRSEPLAQVRKLDEIRVAQFLETKMAPEESAMTGQDSVMHYVSKRRMVSFPPSDDAELICGLLRRYGTPYLVVNLDEDYPYFLPEELHRLEALRTRYGGFDVALFQSGTLAVYSTASCLAGPGAPQNVSTQAASTRLAPSPGPS